MGEPHFAKCGAQPRLIITGCYIGTNSSGTTDLGNGGSGISIGTGSAIIGGTGFGERNVISGNNGTGIFADGGAVEIYNNYIGTNAAGTADLGNSGNGISIGGGTVTVGGTSASNVNQGNVISGNNSNGIGVFSRTAATIQRNLIGTNAAGTGDLGNSLNGISVSGEDVPHLIGSSTNSLNGNVISGNGGGLDNNNGIKIDGVNGVQIFGNRIGTNSAGTAVLQNDRNGIRNY